MPKVTNCTCRRETNKNSARKMRLQRKEELNHLLQDRNDLQDKVRFLSYESSHRFLSYESSQGENKIRVAMWLIVLDQHGYHKLSTLDWTPSKYESQSLTPPDKYSRMSGFLPTLIRSREGCTLFIDLRLVTPLRRLISVQLTARTRDLRASQKALRSLQDSCLARDASHKASAYSHELLVIELVRHLACLRSYIGKPLEKVVLSQMAAQFAHYLPAEEVRIFSCSIFFGPGIIMLITRVSEAKCAWPAFSLPLSPFRRYSVQWLRWSILSQKGRSGPWRFGPARSHSWRSTNNGICTEHGERLQGWWRRCPYQRYAARDSIGRALPNGMPNLLRSWLLRAPFSAHWILLYGSEVIPLTQSFCPRSAFVIVIANCPWRCPRSNSDKKLFQPAFANSL